MRAVIFGVLASLASTGSAASADLSTSTHIIPAGPVSGTWTGCFVGMHAGGLWADADKWIVRTPGGAFYGQSLGGHRLDSVIAGGQAGCDYRFGAGFVAGVQGDLAFADAEGSHASAREFGVSYHSKVRSLVSLTGRAGYAQDRLLGYVRGGIAWERDDYSASTIITGIAYKSGDTHTGWTAGLGAEYALTDLISGFLEVNYYDFGTDTIAFTPQIAGLPTGYIGIESTTTVLRAGINFRFGR